MDHHSILRRERDGVKWLPILVFCIKVQMNGTKREVNTSKVCRLVQKVLLNGGEGPIMPSKPRRPCAKVGCRNLTADAYCEDHKPDRTYDDRRESAYKRGYDSKWRKARLGWLRNHPLCVTCESDGYIVQATVVDHIKPHKGDKVLFWDRTNWQSLCKRHHDQKTVREDGGFGNEQNGKRRQ